MVTEAPAKITGEASDFDVVCRLLEGAETAVVEFAGRAAVPAAAAAGLAVRFLEETGEEVKDRRGLEGGNVVEGMVGLMLRGHLELLRRMPCSVDLSDWLCLVAMGYVSEWMVRPENSPQEEAPPANVLPLCGPSDLSSRDRLVLSLLRLGYRARDLSLVLGVPLSAAVALSYEARRKARALPVEEAPTPCRVSGRSLVAWLDGAVTKQAGGRFERHIRRCPVCRKRIKSLRAAVSMTGGGKATPCPPISFLCRYGGKGLPLPSVPTREIEDHIARCVHCQRTLVFFRVRAPHAGPVSVHLPDETVGRLRDQIETSVRQRLPTVGFGVAPDCCRVLYATGDRGYDIYQAKGRILPCEGTSLEVDGISLQIKCLPDGPPEEERCSIGIVFDGLSARLPVFLLLEGTEEKQVTLKEGGVEFRLIRMGNHLLRFGRFKALEVLVDIKPFQPRFRDLAWGSDLLFERCMEAEGTPMEIPYFYQLSTSSLQAATKRPGASEALLRLLRAYFVKPITEIDPGRLAKYGRVGAADRAAYRRFLGAGPVRAIGWIKAAAKDRGLGELLHPLAEIFSAYAERDRERLALALSRLSRGSLPINEETERFAASLADWIREPDRGQRLREDLLYRLGSRYVNGLIALGSEPLTPLA